MNICHMYGKKWRYEFDHTKSGVVTFGETKPIHSQLMREREWMLGDSVVDELFKDKNSWGIEELCALFRNTIKG